MSKPSTTSARSTVAGMTFADGHSDIRKWKDSDVSQVRRNGPLVIPNDVSFLPDAGRTDHAWFTNHIAPIR